ncbi:MAG: FecR family protein, partial [Nitrosomonadaceae bacterium]
MEKRRHYPFWNLRHWEGFSLVELLVVIVIVGILTTVSYVAVQRVRTRALNEKMLDDLVMIANVMEDYRRDHDRKFPLPDPNSNQNIVCYYSDATYAHDCDDASFRVGMIDNNLLSERYLREVPTDPRTGSRYVYGVTNDGKYFQVAGVFEGEDGYEARTVANLAKGFQLPSVIRAFDGPNFVVDQGTYLPYSPDHMMLSGVLDNISGTVKVGVIPTSRVDADIVRNGFQVLQNDVIYTETGSSVDIYFSDGSITHLDADSELEFTNMQVDKNDKDGTITKILLKLNAGKIWSKVVRLAQESEFKVETTSAIAGVRGTEYELIQHPDGRMELILIAGAVDVFEDEADETAEPVEEREEERLGRTVRIARRAIFDASGVLDGAVQDIGAENLATIINNRYGIVSLNTNIRPHILAVQGTGAGEGTIAVRDANHFTDIVNAILSLRFGLDEDSIDRRILVSHLAVYNLVSDTINPFAPLYRMPISALATDPYALALNGRTESLILRFEYWTNNFVADNGLTLERQYEYWSSRSNSLTNESDLMNESDDQNPPLDRLVRISAFAQIPIVLEADMDLTQFDLYPILREIRPELRVMYAPPIVSLSGAPGNYDPEPFTLNMALENYRIPENTDLTYSVSHRGPPGPCNAASGTISTKVFDVPVTAIGEGVCDLIVSLELADGEQLESTEPIVVNAVSETARLVLLRPRDNEEFTIVDDAVEPTIDVELLWDAPLAGDVRFAVDLDQSGTPELSDNGGVDSHYTWTNRAAGASYTWQVLMSDRIGTTLLETSLLRTFSVTQFAAAATEEILVKEVGARQFIFDDRMTTNVRPDILTPLQLEFSVPTYDENFAYEWSGSDPAGGNLALTPDPPPAVPADDPDYYPNVVADIAINATEEKEPQTYNVFLNIYNTDGAGGRTSLAETKSKTFTVTYNTTTITSIALDVPLDTALIAGTTVEDVATLFAGINVGLSDGGTMTIPPEYCIFTVPDMNKITVAMREEQREALQQMRSGSGEFEGDFDVILLAVEDPLGGLELPSLPDLPDIQADPCDPDPCNGHGVCVEGECDSCDVGFDPNARCGACLLGFDPQANCGA